MQIDERYYKRAFRFRCTIFENGFNKKIASPLRGGGSDFG
ncbi:MAG: hypothetical protein ANABAC_2820 [Anaerolineae bacterium]|nr:MAG: hypothetical protein ANABAC_2820 [Anaerolineae bacterium]